jgi:hypothetical protein
MRREGWQHTALGRVCVGVILAQGLAYGLRMFCTAAASVSDDEASTVWAGLYGLILLQGLQIVGLLVGSGLAGAGQARAALLGAAVGLLNSCVVLILQAVNGEPVTRLDLYGQPLLYLVVGLAGGCAGRIIWRPLPTLRLASPPGAMKNLKSQSARALQTLNAPVSWMRVLLGTGIVLIGVFWPKAILDFILEAGHGKITVSTHLQARLVTWEVMALFAVLGAGLAGTNTFSGAKQGICVAIAASLCFLAVQLGRGRALAGDQVLLTLVVLLVLGLVGGWFGGALFPPVVSRARRRGSGAVALTRADG